MSEATVLDPVIGFLIAGAFAFLFAHAALNKWRSLAEFGAVLANYRLLPGRVMTAAAAAVPAVESAVALLLLAPATRPAAAMAGAALLVAYGGAIAINLWRGRRDLDCGCTGPADRRPIAAWMVWRNAVLAAVLATAAGPWSGRALGWVDLVTVGGGLAVLVVLYVTIDRLLGKVMPRGAELRGAR